LSSGAILCERVLFLERKKKKKKERKKRGGGGGKERGRED